MDGTCIEDCKLFLMEQVGNGRYENAECVCPKCGKKFKVGISRHFDYYVDEMTED